jgi:hypothetical protein
MRTCVLTSTILAVLYSSIAQETPLDDVNFDWRKGSSQGINSKHFAVEIAGLRVGNRVKRGPHWTFGNQDGGNGKLGTVVEFRRWRADDDGIIGARVRWDDNGKVNTYRWPLNQSFPVDLSPTGDDVPLESIHVPAYEDDFAQ